MKYFKNQINSRTLILVIFLGLIITSCEWIFNLGEDEEPDYHHKINVTILNCDSLGNISHDLFYDAQNKLIVYQHETDGMSEPYELKALYSANTIQLGNYYFSLDEQKRVVRIVHHDYERTYEFDGDYLVKETYRAPHENGEDHDYTVYSKYENGIHVSDSTIHWNYTTITHYTYSTIQRPNFMVDTGWGWGLYEFKTRSAYLIESSTSQNYFERGPGLNVTNIYYNYQISSNQVICNVSYEEIPKMSENCSTYQLRYTLETKQ